MSHVVIALYDRTGKEISRRIVPKDIANDHEVVVTPINLPKWELLEGYANTPYESKVLYLYTHGLDQHVAETIVSLQIDQLDESIQYRKDLSQEERTIYGRWLRSFK